MDSYDNMLISGDFSAEKFEFMSIKILECGLKKGQILGEGEKPKDNVKKIKKTNFSFFFIY